MREKKDYAFLQPVQIGNRTFKNRIIYPAMCKLVLTFSACFPSAVNMVAVASLENRNATLAFEGVALTTILSMVSIPVWIILLSTLFGML